MNYFKQKLSGGGTKINNGVFDKTMIDPQFADIVIRKPNGKVF